MNSSIRNLRKRLIASIISVGIAFAALASATYAWYVVNNRVQGTTTSISATTNGFILQIATAEDGAQHGDSHLSLAASTEGGKISPSSTDDANTWYVSGGWNSAGKVTSYYEPTFSADDDAKPGQYGSDSDPHYAYIKSEYVLYTITESGYADVYLDASEGKPVEVTTTGTATTETVPKSMRVGITVQDMDKDGNDFGDEELKVVYAPYEETADSYGNDADSIGGWSCIGTGADGKLKPVSVTYPYIYDETYTDQNGKGWTATKNGEAYVVGTDTEKTAAKVGYSGIKVRVYIWMEGTDSDCVNNEAAEDTATYDVAVHFAGVAAGE
mgnify:CR=1 FL=1